MISLDYPYIRDISSPLSLEQLKPLDPRCKRVQFRSMLTENDFRKLADFLRENPGVELRVYGNYDKTISNLSFLKYFPFIDNFSVDVLDLDSFSDLSYLPSSLVKLGISQTRSKKHSLCVLECFPNLRKLYLEGHTKDIETISKLTNLEDLTLRSITLHDLSLLIPLTRLKSLAIKLGGTSDLRLLPKVGKLQYLELWLIRGFSDLSPIAQTNSLQYIFLQALKNVTKLPEMGELTSLRRLHLETMKSLNDLEPIRTAPVLEELIISDMKQLKPEAFKPLVGHPSLTAISIYIGSFKKNNAVNGMFKLPKVQGGKEGFTFI